MIPYVRSLVMSSCIFLLEGFEDDAGCLMIQLSCYGCVVNHLLNAYPIIMMGVSVISRFLLEGQ